MMTSITHSMHGIGVRAAGKQSKSQRCCKPRMLKTVYNFDPKNAVRSLDAQGVLSYCHPPERLLDTSNSWVNKHDESVPCPNTTFQTSSSLSFLPSHDDLLFLGIVFTGWYCLMRLSELVEVSLSIPMTGASVTTGKQSHDAVSS